MAHHCRQLKGGQFYNPMVGQSLPAAVHATSVRTPVPGRAGALSQGRGRGGTDETRALRCTLPAAAAGSCTARSRGAAGCWRGRSGNAGNTQSIAQLFDRLLLQLMTAVPQPESLLLQNICRDSLGLNRDFKEPGYVIGTVARNVSSPGLGNSRSR